MYMAKTRNRPFPLSERSERRFRQGKRIGFTARSSLKSMGRISRSSGLYELGRKYENGLTN
jgi:hypothetical protein